MWRLSSAIVAGVWLLIASAPHVSAQSAAPTVQPPWDVVAAFGWFGARQDEVVRYQDWNRRGWQASLTFGRYWTDHWKTEMELAGAARMPSQGTTPVDLTAFPEVPPQYAPYYIFVEHRFSNFRLSIGQTYQFLRNEWVHPFVGAGIDIDRERHQTWSPWQGIPRIVGGGPQGDLAEFPEARTDEAGWQARPFALAGVKVYVARRAFFRGDARLAFASRLDQAAMRIGFGVDF
jgi:hypothetical protein